MTDIKKTYVVITTVDKIEMDSQPLADIYAFAVNHENSAFIADWSPEEVGEHSQKVTAEVISE